MTQTSFLQQYSHLPSDRQWDTGNISPCDLCNTNAEKCTASAWSQAMAEDTTDRRKADFYSSQSTRFKETFTSFREKVSQKLTLNIHFKTLLGKKYIVLIILEPTCFVQILWLIPKRILFFLKSNCSKGHYQPPFQKPFLGPALPTLSSH